MRSDWKHCQFADLEPRLRKEAEREEGRYSDRACRDHDRKAASFLSRIVNWLRSLNH